MRARGRTVTALSSSAESPAHPLRILLVDDDATARRALRDAIDGRPGMEVVGEATGGSDALASVAAVQPDIVVMDAEMPDVDGITATLRINEHGLDVPVVILAIGEDEELALLALRSGAVGFLPKSVPIDAILRSIAAVAAGEAAVSRTLTRRVIAELRDLAQRASGMRPVESELTPREWQVLDLLSQSASTPEIAHRLGLSVDTVRTHIRHVLRKLGAHSRAEAVAAAARMRTSGGSGYDDEHVGDDERLGDGLR